MPDKGKLIRRGGGAGEKAAPSHVIRRGARGTKFTHAPLSRVSYPKGDL